MSFHHVFQCLVIFSLCWWDVCLQWLSSLSLAGFFYFLFSLLSWNYKLALLVISISTSVLFFWFLIFSFGSFIEVLFIFNFIIEFKFTRYYILQFHPYSLDFYFFISLFVKVLLVFNFILQFKLMILYFPI